MRRRSRPSPALRVAVRAGAARRVGAAVAVPLLRRRAADPRPGDGRRLRRRAARRSRSCARAPRSATSPSSRCRCGPSRWSTSCPTTIPSALRAPAADPLPDRRRPGASAAAGCRTRGCSGPSRGPAGSNALDRVLTWVHWLWFFEPHLRAALDPRPPQRALPARRPPDGRGLRPRLRRLLRRADRAALVGLRGGPDRRGGAADHGRGRRGDLGPAWPRMYDALGGNPWAAMPSLHFATSLMAALLLAEAGRRGRRRLGLRADLGFALVYLGEHYVVDLLAGAALVAAVRRGEPLAEPLVLGGQRRAAAAGAHRERVASRASVSRAGRSEEASRRGRRDGRRDRRRGRRRAVFDDPRRLIQTAGRRRRCCSSRSTSCSRSWSGSTTRSSKLDEADPVWIAVAVGFNVARLRAPTSLSSASSAATCCT